MSDEAVTPEATPHPTDQPAENQSGTRPHDDKVPEAWRAFMMQGWGERALDVPAHPVAPHAAARRARLAEAFAGERLVIPSGGYKVRANDTDYRFRPDTAHTYFTGNQTSDAVLVIEPDGSAALYARPSAGSDTEEFFRNATYGELWVGRRPSLGELSESLGLEVRHVDGLEDALAGSTKTRVLRGVSAYVDGLVAPDEGLDADLARVASELRLKKDAWEIEQLQEACDITALGFEDSVADWTNAIRYGERWIEGTFFRRARALGNDLGYDSIVGGGRHATTLHWVDNTGPIVPGEMVLLDMGVENRNLYTADITRTLPISGSYTPLQRDLYQLVLDAQQAGIDVVRPGAGFRDPHHAAMAVLAHGLDDLGLLPVSVDEALSEDNRTYARWTLHGTSHMLGLDVHDCAQAGQAAYGKESTLEEGYVLTVEPGLYFQDNDLLVPEELRGIGIRIEDDILVTADGSRNLSAALPRTPDDVEAWMGRHL
ncbi:aminopeptidase P family protein [Nocardioides sp. BP30]|uniref:aminopeptidase P family protein n=1 Tax=Nocardioides sp. BP30 TaxID=3036374 RepID=UPI0024688A64|nr:aminopeptidase P family protein [Nocardioides sp. BP30]WGL51580.1 aminopeptidase P family protein [Nocardioides sp. BP30]